MRPPLRALSIAVLACAAVGVGRGEVPARIVVDDGGTVADITLGPLFDPRGSGRKLSGGGLLRIDGLDTIPVDVRLRVNRKRTKSTYTLRTPKGVEPKLRAKIVAAGEPAAPTKAKLLLRDAEGTTRIKDPSAFAFLGLDAPFPGSDGETAGLSVDLNLSGESGLLAVIENVTGTRVALHGSTDASGDPLRITSAVVTDPDGVTTELVFDALGRPLQTVAENGTTFDWLWVSDRHLRLTATDPTRELGVAIDVDPVTLEEVEAADQEFVPPDVPEDPPAADPGKLNPQTVVVSVLRGGVPYDPQAPPRWVGRAHVTVELTSELGGAYQQTAEAVRTGVGTYDARFVFEGPSELATALRETIRRNLPKLVEAHNYTCAFFAAVNPLILGQACAAIATATAAIPGVQIGAPAIFAACSAAFFAYRAYCQVFKDGGAIGAAFDLEAYLELRLRSLLAGSFRGERVIVRAIVREWNPFSHSLGAPHRSAPVVGRVSRDGTISRLRSALVVDLPAEPPRIRLRLSPLRPRVGSGYTATADFTGIPVGGSVRLALRERGGADTRSVQATFAEAGSDGSHTLVLQRTLGAANAHNAYAQIFDAGGRQVVIRQLDY